MNILIFLYIALSFADLVLSFSGFNLGVPEGNPLFVFLLKHGLFIPGKIILVISISYGLGYVYKKHYRWPLWFGVIIMTLVFIYHYWGISKLSF